MKKRVLYYSPAWRGGLADYAREQADAMCEQGAEVKLLVSPQFECRPNNRFELLPQLLPATKSKQPQSRLSGRLATIREILSNINVLASCVTSQQCQHVLFGAYAEYLAPLWAGKLRQLARQGVVFGAVVHDPVRDFIVGPVWWHRQSVGSAYSFLREAFLHEPVALDTVKPMPQLSKTVIPHGPYRFAPPNKSREIMRNELNIPENAIVLLSFGHIRDGKNLDLILKALQQFPQIYLVVAGTEQSKGQRPATYYQQLAQALGVAKRCRWIIKFLKEEEVGNYFNAADMVLLTYSAKFRSASGVLNVAVQYRKPCLASSGQSNLEAVVNGYGLGIWIEPDSEATMVAGIKRWLANPPAAEWSRYERENSWTRNAELVMQKLFDN